MTPVASFDSSQNLKAISSLPHKLFPLKMNGLKTNRLKMRGSLKIGPRWRNLR